MRDFEYYAPQTLNEALLLLPEKQDARILAGGTDLIVQMKDGKCQPGVLVDVKHIPELNRLEWVENRSLHIGAAVPFSKITAFPAVKEHFGLLFQACSLIGSVQIRNRATIGGNLCNAAPSADSAPPLLCLGAKALIAGPGKKRTVTLSEFFTGPGQTVLNGDEILVEIEVPAPPAYSAGGYARHTTREEMDIAVVGIACLLVLSPDDNICREARIALGAAAPTPRLLKKAQSIPEGKLLSIRAVHDASETAAIEALPISDVRSSEDYRRALVKILTRRVLTQTWEQLKK